MEKEEIKDLCLAAAFLLVMLGSITCVAKFPPVTQAEYMDVRNGKPDGELGRMLKPPREAQR